MEYVPENGNDKPEDKEDQAWEHNREYGRGMKIRKRPE